MKALSLLYPAGLTTSQFKQLDQYLKPASLLTPDQLLTEADRHVDAAAVAHQKNRLVNLRLAKAIRDVIATLVGEWDRQSEAGRPWLAAAALYFSRAEDEEPDFGSAIGFEDDVEVLNACLRFAQREDLCLNVEDYDDV